MLPLSSCVEHVAKFSGSKLASTIAGLESTYAGLQKNQIAERLSTTEISPELLEAARTVKRAAAQIDVVIHAIGILVILPSILEDSETVESLSLGAGSSETKRFDLETNRRVAEFTFIDWRGNDNTRLQKIFKDFYRLAEFETSKRKEMWVTDDAFALKYLRGRSSIWSATHKHRGVWESCQSKYPDVKHISDYYRLHEAKVLLKVYETGIA